MELHVSLIYEAVKGLSDTVRAINEQRDIGFLHYRFYKTGEDFIDRCVYICDATDLPPQPPADKSIMLIYKSSTPLKAYANSNVPQIWFSAKQSGEDIFNAIQEVHAKYVQWEIIMEQCAENSATPQMILEASFPYIGLLATVVDAAINLIADSSNISYSLSEIPQPERCDTVTPEIVVKSYDSFIKTKDNRVPYIYRSIPHGHLHMGINLFDGTAYIGHLSLMSWPRELRPYDKFLITYLAKYIKQSMLKHLQNEESNIKTIGRIFSRLVHSQLVEESEAKILFANAGFEPNDILRCAAIKLPENAGGEYINYLLRSISNRFPGTASTVQKNYLSVLFNESLTERMYFDVHTSFCGFLESLHLKAGISNPFQEVLLAGKYFEQAKCTADLSVDRAKTILEFEEVCMDIILKNCVGAMQPEMIWPAGMHRLLEHDRNSHVCYLETLQIYLEENMNALSAAKRLFISRNTFTARLARIESLLALNLNDKDVRLRLTISLALYNQTIAVE